jgi:hypothetical protein
MQQPGGNQGMQQPGQVTTISSQDRHMIQRTFMDIINDNKLDIDVSSHIDDEAFMINLINEYSNNRQNQNQGVNNANNNANNANNNNANGASANNKSRFNYRLLFMPVIMTLLFYVVLIYKSDIMRYVNEFRLLNFKYIREFVVSALFFCIYVFLDYII